MDLPPQLQGLRARSADPVLLKVSLPADLADDLELWVERVGGERFRSAVTARILQLGLDRLP